MDRKEELFEDFMTVHELLGTLRHKRMHERGPLGDQTRGQGRVLALLKLKDGVSTKEMAHVLGIRVSSLNETLAKMEKDDLITRRPSDEDKRVMLVGLTQKGKDIELPKHNAPQLLFDCFDEDEQETLAGYFNRMISSLEEELGEDGAAVLEEIRQHRAEFFSHARCHGHHGPHGSHGHGSHSGGRGHHHHHHHHHGSCGCHDHHHGSCDCHHHHGHRHCD